MSQYRVRPKNLSAVAEEIRSAGSRMQSAISEIPSIAITLRHMGCYDPVFTRLMNVQRTGENQSQAIRRLGAGLAEIADTYEHFESRSLEQAANSNILVAAFLPEVQGIHSRWTPPGLYRDEWGGSAAVCWWDPQIPEKQFARLQPVWFEAAQLLTLKNMFTATRGQ